MLMRIAPEIFCDDRFECVTIRQVINELFQTQRFKTNYPWRKEYKSKIKAMGTSEMKKGEFQLIAKVTTVRTRKFSCKRF